MAKKIDINNQAVAVGTEDDAFTLQTLSERIVQVDDSLRAKAEHAVNCLLTARNWFVGYYIVEYEQHGSDRARYGEQLLKVLAKHINRKGMTDRRLREYRQFYRTYPYIGQEIVSYLNPQVENILQPAIAKLPDSQTSKLRSLTAKSSSATEIWRSATAKFTPVQLEPWQTSPDRLLHRLSATHLILLSEITEPLKRAFYEQETMRGSWTVKELDRQISSLYYERSGLSKDKQALVPTIVTLLYATPLKDLKTFMSHGISFSYHPRNPYASISSTTYNQWMKMQRTANLKICPQCNPPFNYVSKNENVSTKVVKIIQSYTGIVNKMVWREN